MPGAQFAILPLLSVTPDTDSDSDSWNLESDQWLCLGGARYPDDREPERAALCYQPQDQLGRGH